MATRGNLQHSGHHGMAPWSVRPSYAAYQSKFGPKYTTAPHFHGIDATRAARFGATAAGFGVVAGVFAVFFFAEVPRMREDVMKKIPILGEYFDVKIAPEDNPF